MIEGWGIQHDTDTGAREQRQATMRPWCAGNVSPAVPFDMPFGRHGDGIAYLRQPYALFRRYLEVLTGKEGLGWLLLCCFESPYYKLYQVRDVAN